MHGNAGAGRDLSPLGLCVRVVCGCEYAAGTYVNTQWHAASVKRHVTKGRLGGGIPHQLVSGGGGGA